jgi:hypothetical protein
MSLGTAPATILVVCALGCGSAGGSASATSGPIKTLASGQSSPYGVAVDSTSVYWTNSGVGTSDGAVMKVPIGGGTPTTLASGPTSFGIAVDATSVYWVSPGTIENNYSDGAVFRLTPK